MSAFAPSHEPPVWWERCLAHPIVWIALWSVLVSAQVLVDPWIPSFHPSPSTGELPRWTAVGLAAALGTGGGCAMLGLLNAWDDRSRAWALERSGWMLCTVGWVAYALVVTQAYPGNTVSWGTGLILAATATTRIIALHVMEKRTRRIRREVNDALTGSVEVIPSDE